MKRVIFALILMILLLCGCRSSETCEEGEFWKIKQISSGNKETYDYIIYNNDREILLEGESKVKPLITFKEFSNICIYIDDSAEYTVQYVCPYSDSVSNVYENPLAWGNGYVAIIGRNEEGESVLTVKSSLGTDSRDYKLLLCADMPIEDAILGAAFDKYDENLTVIYISEDNKHCTAVLPIDLHDWENNPIDRFYDKYMVETYSTPETAAAAYCEKEIWKAELENAYQLLRGMANPKVESLQHDIDESAKAFEEYVEAYGEIYMAYEWSSAYQNDGVEWSDDIFYGTGASGEASACKAKLYRQATLDLYRMMNDRFESVDEAFIFDEQEYLNFLRKNSYLNVINNENGEVFSFEGTVKDAETYIFRIYRAQAEGEYYLTYARKNTPEAITDTITYESNVISCYDLAHLEDTDGDGSMELLICMEKNIEEDGNYKVYRWNDTEEKYEESM